jgi:hypothetical protein
MFFVVVFVEGSQFGKNTSHISTIPNIKYIRVEKKWRIQINCKMIVQRLKFIKNYMKIVFGNMVIKCFIKAILTMISIQNKLLFINSKLNNVKHPHRFY